MSPFPGPAVLGRGVVLLAGQHPPAGCESWPRHELDAAALAEPKPLADRLHAAWQRRSPVVVVLAVDPAQLREPERCERPVYELGAGFEFARERLQYLVWSNNYDCRSGEPVWWHARRALRLGALEAGAPGPAAPPGGSRAAPPPAPPAGEGAGDVLLPGSLQAAWCDGGPRRLLDTGDGAAVVHRDAIEAGSLAPETARPLSAELAADQLAPVEHPAGPARVIAPAGSGKTRVLTERLRYLLAGRRLPPSEVLAVAFNRRAADELEQRSAGLGAHIRTLNSLGLAVLNGARPFAATGQPARRVIDEPEVRRILETLVKVTRRANTDPYLPYLDALSLIRLGLVEPAVAGELVPDAAGIAEVFADYRAILAERSLVDFDEQIYGAVELLVREPDLRRQDQRVARHLLVDEFQDLTPAHVLLLRLLAAPGYDVFGVGDDDQVIYSYAGASPEFLLRYAAYFPGAGEYALQVNYRCPPAVIESVANLLSHNAVRIEKKVAAPAGRIGPKPSGAAAGAPGGLSVEHVPAVRQAGRALEVVRRWLAEGTPAEQIAVLARVGASLLPAQVVLAEAGVASTSPLGEEVLARTGMRSALAYLRAAADPEHIARRDVLETVRRPSRRIAPNVLEMLGKRAFTGITDIRRLAGSLSGRDVERLLEYAEDLALLGRAAATKTTAEVLAAIRTRVGLGGAMDTLDASRREADRSSHLDDLRALEQLAGLHADPRGFEAWLRGVLSRAPSAPADEAPAAAVTLSTVHRVKGREWHKVLVVGADAEQFPHRLASDVEEERRVFHVALTRGAEEVLVLADSAGPSPFCDELYRRAPRRADHGGARATARRRRELPEAAPSSRASRPGEEAVFEALRAWRSATAAAEQVPAYVVFSDAHLRAIATAAPAKLDALARCPGVGPVKLERYGEEVLGVLDGALARSPARR